MSKLMRVLDDISQQAKVYDVVDRAEARGRRRRRLAQTLTASSAVLTILVAGAAVGWYRELAPTPPPLAATRTGSASPTTVSPAAPLPPANCAPQVLPVPAGYPSKAVVTGGDPTGRFLVGRAYPTDSRPRLLVWDHGSVSTRAMPGSDADLYDINDSGEAVGWSFVTDNTTAAYYYDQQGHRTQLKGTNATAMNINASGVIVGSTGVGNAVVWRSPTAEPERVPVPAGLSRAVVMAIDDDGTMVGQAFDGSNVQGRFIRWHPDGTMDDLTAQVPATGQDGAAAAGVFLKDYRNGWLLAAQKIDLPGGVGFKFAQVLVNIDTGEVRRIDGFQAYAVNAQGWVLGEDVTGAVVYSAGDPVRLPTLPDVADRQDYAQLSSISDDGRTIGASMVYYSRPIEESNVPFVWHCT